MVKKCLVILIVALANICCVARAEVALSYLGMCHKTWPCQSSLKAFNRVAVIKTGWLEGTFAEDCQCADTLLQDPRPKVIRVHLTNGACLRNRRCGRYEVWAGETIASGDKKVRERNVRLLARYRKAVKVFRDRLSRSQGGLTCYVSPVLESDYGRPARRVLRSITHRYLPSCAHVDSVLRGHCLKGSICEKHGPEPGLHAPCISDLDGIPVEAISLQAFLRATDQCDLRFVWTGGFNCNPYSQGRFIDPRERDCSVPRGYFRLFNRVLRREE
jgi:hypothetical protein